MRASIPAPRAESPRIAGSRQDELAQQLAAELPAGSAGRGRDRRRPDRDLYRPTPIRTVRRRSFARLLVGISVTVRDHQTVHELEQVARHTQSTEGIDESPIS